MFYIFDMQKINNSKMMRGTLLSVAALIAAQTLALVISDLLVTVGVNTAICNVTTGFLYVGFAWMMIKLLCEKNLEMPMSEMRIPQIRLKKVRIISAVLMPFCVVFLSFLSGGEWVKNTFDLETEAEIITSAVFFYGFGAGIVEEIVFRGMIMGCLEKRFNTKAAIIIPSVLFGAVHVIGNDLSPTNMVQVLISGSVVGILFSMISYESGSVWNSAVVHAFWNMTVGIGIIHIGADADKSSIFNFILRNKSFLLTGSDDRTGLGGENS